MADVGTLSFSDFIERKNEKLPEGGKDDGRGYAYVSDPHTRKAIDTLKPVEVAIPAAVKHTEAYGKSELLGRSVRVGPKQFPRVDALAKQAANTLGIKPPTLYIINDPVMNAATFGTNEDSVIMVHSALVDHFSDEELLSVIGHECGHIHNQHVVYLTALHYLRYMAAAVFRALLAPAEIALMSWMRRAEITCDRAGLLCCQNVDVATRALTKLALGSSKLYDQLNMDAFLEQYEELRDGLGRFSEIRASHPMLPKRVLSLKHFSESELYRTHAGVGAGGLSMIEVDKKVHEIIRVLG